MQENAEGQIQTMGQPPAEDLFAENNKIPDIDSWLKETLPFPSENAGKEDKYRKNQKSFDALLEESYISMDGEFLTYLKNFNNNSYESEKLKLDLKRKFFHLIMLMLIALIALPYVMLFLFKDKVTDMSIIVLSISSLAEIISAIIVLPKIIAKYLFNKNEEMNKINIITGMQEYNRNKRKEK